MPPADDTFQVALATCDRLFSTATNVLVERHRFKKRLQNPGESTEAYISCLRELARTCEWDGSPEVAVRDQLVSGVASDKLRERLLFEGAGLTLERAIAIASHYEETLKSLQEFSASEGMKQIRKSSMNATRTRDSAASRSAPARDARERRCYRCGPTQHMANSKSCKARDKRCSKCKKVGHFQAVCRSTKDEQSVKQVREQGEARTTLLHVVTSEARRGIYVKVQVEGVEVQFLVDTGSSVSIITEDIYMMHYQATMPLTAPSVTLLDFSSGEISVKGCFLANVLYQQRSTCVLFYVVRQGTAVLGLDAIRNLDFCIQGSTLQCLQTSVQTSTSFARLPIEFRAEFGHLFTDEVGLVKGFAHHVKRKPGVPPVAAKLRRLPLALREQVSAELRRLEQCGIIESVDASEWISPIVVVRKQDGRIRLCVDLREVNKAIIVDGFPLPHTEELLHQLAGATHFSKIDLASAYHQLELTPESRDLTTFVTHEGLFRFRRVCFGLASAPATFQKMMTALLKGCKGATSMMLSSTGSQR